MMFALDSRGELRGDRAQHRRPSLKSYDPLPVSREKREMGIGGNLRNSRHRHTLFFKDTAKKVVSIVPRHI